MNPCDSPSTRPVGSIAATMEAIIAALPAWMVLSDRRRTEIAAMLGSADALGLGERWAMVETRATGGGAAMVLVSVYGRDEDGIVRGDSVDLWSCPGPRSLSPRRNAAPGKGGR
jgi:hypothetical protein